MPRSLVLVLLFPNFINVSSLGDARARVGSLRASGTSQDQGPSPAELEEEEEDGTDEQEVSAAAVVPVAAGVPAAGVVPAVQSAPTYSAQPALNPRVDLQLASVATADDAMPAVALPQLQSRSSGMEQALPPPLNNNDDQADLIDDAEPSAVPVEPPISSPESSAPRPIRSQPVKAKPSQFAAAKPSQFAAVRQDTKDVGDKAAAIQQPKSLNIPTSASAAPSNVSSLHQDKPADFEPMPQEDSSKCSPPCIQGRGSCNNKVCFCRSPYSGTTCQHKMDPVMRFSYPMLVAFALVSLFLGGMAAQCVHAVVISHKQQAQSARLGEGTTCKEVWCPPNAKGGYK